MNGILLSTLFQFVLLNNLDNKKENSENVFHTESSSEFYGSLDKDEFGSFLFYHVPTGLIKPAIIYKHQMTFAKRSDRLKALKNVGKNVKIKGQILKINELEILIVESIDILQLEI